MRLRLGRGAVVGDRVGVGAIQLTVRRMDAAGNVVAVGLKVPHAGEH